MTASPRSTIACAVNRRRAGEFQSDSASGATRAQKNPNFGEPKGCLTITESITCILRVWGPCQGHPVDTARVASGETERHQEKGSPLGHAQACPARVGPCFPYKQQARLP